MDGRLDRKTFLTTLGAAGLGLGLAATTGGERSTLAHENVTVGAQARPAGGVGPLDEHLQQRAAFYQDFTAALTEALRGAPLNGQEPSPSGVPPSGVEQSGRDQSRVPADQSGAPSDEAPPRRGRPGQGGASPSETPAGDLASGADLVDAAIRQALMTVIDARRAQGGLTYGQAEAMKTLVATDAAPITPEPISLL